MADEDPFLQVQQDVLAQLTSTRPLFSSYLRIRSHASSATSPELSSARSDLETALASLAEDLSDLVASVQAVESDPTSFGLSASELQRRRKLVQDVGREVASMRGDLAQKIQPGLNTGAGDLPDPNAFAIPDGDGGNVGDDDYAEFEQQQQRQMLREQDEHLDGVFQTVGNLRRQADDMGRELEEQREMLEHVDGLADRVGGRLATGMQKLNYVIRKNEDRWSGCCIGMLILVLCILLVLLLIL